MYDHVIELCHSINGTLNTYVQLKSTTMLKYWVVKMTFQLTVFTFSVFHYGSEVHKFGILLS